MSSWLALKVGRGRAVLGIRETQPQLDFNHGARRCPVYDQCLAVWARVPSPCGDAPPSLWPPPWRGSVRAFLTRCGPLVFVWAAAGDGSTPLPGPRRVRQHRTIPRPGYRPYGSRSLGSYSTFGMQRLIFSAKYRLLVRCGCSTCRPKIRSGMSIGVICKLVYLVLVSNSQLGLDSCAGAVPQARSLSALETLFLNGFLLGNNPATITVVQPR
eukprot:SAG25_NODE_341_length_9456_cov_13.967938_3_plen_213_part_00